MRKIARATVAVAVVVGGFGWAPPAAAGVDIRLSAPVTYQLASVDGGQYPYHVYGPSGQMVEVSVDLSAVSQSVRVEPATTECSSEGQGIRCLLPAEPDGRGFNLSIDPVTGAPLGPAGTFTLRVTAEGVEDTNPGNNSARVTLDVVDSTSGARVEVSAPNVPGAIGQTVSVPVTIRNYGPNTLRMAWVSNVIPQSGATYIAHIGCAWQDSQTKACATGVIPVGKSAVVKVKLRIDGCIYPLPPISAYEQNQFIWSYVPGTGRETTVQRPHADFIVSVAGCAFPTEKRRVPQTEGGGATTVPASPTEETSPSPSSATVEPSASSPVAVQKGRFTEAAVQRGPWVPTSAVAALGALLLLAAFLMFSYRRRRASALTSETADESS